MDTEERLQPNSTPVSEGFRYDATMGRAASFFSSPELIQRLDLLRHLTENSELIPLVKGIEGAGKSALIEQLMQLASDNWVIANIEANPMMQPDQLLVALAATFSKAADGRSMEHLIQRFGYLRQDGLLPVVIVDDAHLLPEASIITLLRLHERRQGDAVLVRILLFAEPEVDNLLKTPQIQAMNILALQSLDMPRLTRSQTEQFARQLLTAEDPSGRLGLNSSRIDKIFQESDGLPGRVRDMVLESIFAGMANSRWRIWKPGSPLATFGIAVVIVILLLILVFQDSINGIFGTAPEREDSMTSIPSPQGKVVPLQLPAPESVVEIRQPPADTEAFDAGAPGQLPDAEPAQEAAPQVSSPEQVSKPVPVELPVVSNTAEELRERDVTRDGAEGAVQEPIPSEEAVPEDVAPEPVPKESPAAVEVVSPEPTEEAPAAVSAPVPAEPEKASAPAVAETVAETASPAVDQVVPTAEKQESAPVKAGSEEWLLQQSPGSYTLQLIGLQDEAGVARFLARNKLPGQTAYFRTSRQGKSWFPVLYGIFPNRDAALAARDRLPENLKKTDVWPRSLESVQKEIRNR